MSLSHILKVFVFMYFDLFLITLALIIAMVIGAIAGSWVELN